jgi:hypothetical protein
MPVNRKILILQIKVIQSIYRGRTHIAENTYAISRFLAKILPVPISQNCVGV